MALTDQGIPLVGPLLNKIIGSRNERFVKKYTTRADAINALEPEMRALTDAQIRERVESLRERARGGQKAADLLVEAFAVAREAMDRSVGIRNIFNPDAGFDPNQLTGEARAAYDETLARMQEAETIIPMTAAPAAGVEPNDPDDLLLGCAEPVPGWQTVDIPNVIYEAVRELYPESRPPFRARPFDVQLIGGMVLQSGKISEMKTGEGKTIVAPLATMLAVIEGMRVHVVTVNDYLVQRDRDWTFPFFRAIGMTVGAIHPVHSQPEAVKREMYRCDVVYGTTSEFGFDYLRDNMKRSADLQVQRVREMAIVDEVDSILIDEARTPLIISGPAHEDAPRYDMADKLALALVEKQRPWQAEEDKVQACNVEIKGLEGDIRTARDKGKIPELKSQLDAARGRLPGLEAERNRHTQYYELKLDRKACYLTHEGIAEAQRIAGVGSFYVGENMDIPHLLENALRARAVYERDRDYVVLPVKDPHTGAEELSVVIVDTNTGRPMYGRQWSDGLHQAVESKEGVPIKQETQTVASITIQNFFKMYKRLAGMTGTADTEAQEFHDIYRLDVVAIPTNKPVVRHDHDDLMYLVAKDKWQGIVDEIKRFHDAGRPVLVGTTSVEASESLSAMLTRKHGVTHEVLNAKQHEREAHIVVNAGQLGAVTIATNMAGRGTDIKLGQFTRQELVDHWLRRGIASKGLTPESTEDELRENVYRKLAPSELEIPKREAESMDFAQLEAALLRRWAEQTTYESSKRIASASADELRDMLDATGRLELHRIRWYDDVQDLGGLHVIGTERHESRRIDNQLRGRGGRQGDNGSSRFFVSLEDDLMKLFAGGAQMKFLSRMGMKEGDAIEHPWLSKAVERAQRKVEQRNFQVRKQLLEYDEVMEHQRQDIYGMRQRVLDGKDVKGLVFEQIERAVDDAVETYLDKDYPAECAAEFAHNALDCSIQSDRLRGRELDEMIDRIRTDARDDARASMTMTIGEYWPDVSSDAPEVDFDAEALKRWAKSHYDVELDDDDLANPDADTRRRVESVLMEAAEERIENADLSGISKFTDEAFGANELKSWIERKFDFEFAPQDVKSDDGSSESPADRRAAVRDAIMERVTDLYNQREVEYPVDFAMDMTMAIMRQSPQAAAEQLCTWVNRRYGLGWTPDSLRALAPNKAREQLLEENRKFVENDRMSEIIAEGAALTSDEALEAFFRDRLGMALPRDVKRLRDPEDRKTAVEGRIESTMRAELLHLERMLMLDTIDPCWKDHLGAMDRIRGAIGFRSISQQDPRIAFKREGASAYREMRDTLCDRLTDFVLKARPMPSDAIAQQQRAAAARQAAAQQAQTTSGGAGGSISGPGLDQAPAGSPAPAPQSAPAQQGNGSSSPRPAATQARGSTKDRSGTRFKKRKK